jgi:hypothetical protein
MFINQVEREIEKVLIVVPITDFTDNKSFFFVKKKSVPKFGTFFN